MSRGGLWVWRKNLDGSSERGRVWLFAGRLAGDSAARVHLVVNQIVPHFGGLRALCGARAIKPVRWIPSDKRWVSCSTCISAFDHAGGDVNVEKVGESARKAGLIRDASVGPRRG